MLNMKQYFLTLTIILCFISCNIEMDEYEFYNQENKAQNNVYSQFFWENNIPVIIADDVINIGDIMFNDIENFVNFLLLKMDIIRKNIENANNTIRDDTGCVFKPNDIIIINGKPIIKERETINRFVYDPLHKDAIKEGLWTGYVEYPHIDIVIEIVNLLSVDYIFITFYKELEKNGLLISINPEEILEENIDYIKRKINIIEEEN